MASVKFGLFVDVTGEPMARKMLALVRYGSEMRQPPHPRSHGVIEALAAVRGSAAGVSHAEAFEIVRDIA